MIDPTTITAADLDRAYDFGNRMGLANHEMSTDALIMAVDAIHWADAQTVDPIDAHLSDKINSLLHPEATS